MAGPCYAREEAAQHAPPCPHKHHTFAVPGADALPDVVAALNYEDLTARQSQGPCDGQPNHTWRRWSPQSNTEHTERKRVDIGGMAVPAPTCSDDHALHSAALTTTIPSQPINRLPALPH